MGQLGEKWECANCSAKFYDLGKSVPLCPKCGANAKEAAAAAPAESPSRRRRRDDVAKKRRTEEPEAVESAEASDDVEEVEEVEATDVGEEGVPDEDVIPGPRRGAADDEEEALDEE